MNAWVLHGKGEIQLESVERPVPGVGEVLVAVKATGICGSDIPRIYRTGAYRYPLIPGHEFSGVVEEVGAGTDSGWKGKRVGIFPLIPCRECGPCREKKYEMCRNYSYLGSRRDGGFAEYVVVPADNLIELPDKVSFEEAAMLEPMAVAVHAMRRIWPEGVPGERDTVAICGLGTIGMLLLMFLMEALSSDGQEMGQIPVSSNRDFQRREAFWQGKGRILVIGNKDFQRRKALELGVPADSYCDSRKQDVGQWLMECTEGLGADVFFECVGQNETLSQALENTAPAGRICLVGNPDSDMVLARSVYWKLLRRQLTVTGTWNSSFTHEPGDDWNYVLDRLSQGRIAPGRFISHSFPLEELEQGFRMMRDKTQSYGKVMGRIIKEVEQ